MRLNYFEFYKVATKQSRYLQNTQSNS